MSDRVYQELPDERVDRPVERGREEEPLAAAGRLCEQPAHRGKEAQVGHVVGLVDDGDLDGGQAAVSLRDQVLKSSGTGHEDVDASAKSGHLRVLADATEDRARGEASGLRQRCEGLVDLVGQLAGGRQDERSWCLGPGRAAVGEPGHQRKQEGIGLAGARAATAEHVAPGKGVGQSSGLDRRWGVDAEAGQDVCETCGHADVRE